MARKQAPRTLGPAVAKFFAGTLSHKKGPMAGRPFVLEEWQRRDLDLIYEVDKNGRRVWRDVLLGWPRGNGKSPLCAGIGLLELVSRKDEPEVFEAAGSRDQAGTLHSFALDLPRGGVLEKHLQFPESRRSPIFCPANHGYMRVLAADGNLAHSLSPSIAILDELHVFRTDRQEELYFALASAMHKRVDSVMLCVTTAGETKASLLGELYDSIIKTHELEYDDLGVRCVARNRDAGSLMIWRSATEDADISDPRIWRAVNPASWISLDEIERMAHRVPEQVFRRLILNQWTIGDNAAIQPALWDACEAASPVVEPGDAVWVGVDLGERHDTSAIALIAEKGDKLAVKVRIIDPAEHGRKTLLPVVERELIDLAESYELVAVAYDRWQMADLANRLAGNGMRMVEVPQNDSHMVPASQRLLDLIADGHIVHDGDPVLRRHVLGAAAKQTARGGWRFDKPKVSRAGTHDERVKIDGLIALTLAAEAWHKDKEGGAAPWADLW
jgi:phage terminase large subunit-like protein